MTTPGQDPQDPQREQWLPPAYPQRPQWPGPEHWKEEHRRRYGRGEVLLKILAVVSVLVVLGVFAAGALVVMAVASYGDNK